MWSVFTPTLCKDSKDFAPNSSSPTQPKNETDEVDDDDDNTFPAA
jgi:hypothetical protein